MENRYKCPCCGALSLDEERDWDICELCWWEDDPYQSDNPDSDGGPNHSSLNKCKNKFNHSINELIKGEFYCTLLEKKIDLGLCSEIILVVSGILLKDSVEEIDNISRASCEEHCNNCPLAKL